MSRWAARPLVVGTGTWIGPSIRLRSFQSAAAESWLRTARPPSRAGAFELLPCDDPVLSRGDFRHLQIGRVDFMTHVGA
jgi:hypothetical protein